MDNPGGPVILRRMERNDVVIVGGSLNGAILAIALGRAGLGVTVVEPRAAEMRSAERFDGRSYAMALASVRMLEALDLWEPLADLAQPILKITVSDGRPGKGPAPQVLTFDHAELEEGPMGHMVEDRHLRPLLQHRMAATPGVTVLSGVSVTEQRPGPDAVEIGLSDGRRITAALLVGADGSQGPTAGRAGIRRRVTRYGQMAMVCAIAHERPHHGIAHQFFMPSGPLAILPLSGDRSSIVWTERSGQAAAVQALDDAGYLAVLRPRFGDFLGEIALAGDRYTYPLDLSLAERFTAPRLALVGDAARRVHPIAGQGLNAGLKDVAALAETVVEARRRGEDFGRADVLDRYARWRRFDTAALACATDGFNRLFSNDNPVLRLGRDLGLGAVNAVPVLRRAFMREAAGLTGDLPRLLSGEPL